MDGSFCNQVLAQIMLYKEQFANKTKEEKKIYVNVLPRHLDEEVASLMVKGFGGTLTKLTNEQFDYIGLKKDASFKDPDYRY